MEALLNGPPLETVIIRINSDGGNLEAAMSIGRLLRKAGKSVSVEAGDRCASACVFILAGAVNRIVGGDVIIHRPYLTEDLPGSSGYDENYKHAAEIIRGYLAEMNIPPTLGERILAIPPDESQTLTAMELDRYMLNGKDPADEQEEAAAEAHKFGISLVEQRRRQALQKTVCGWGWSADPDLFELASHGYCRDAVMKGDDPSSIQARIQIVLRKRRAIVSGGENPRIDGASYSGVAAFDCLFAAG
jgi:hypothetical protein